MTNPLMVEFYQILTVINLLITEMARELGSLKLADAKWRES
jgi:hypothetical protein